MGGGVKKVNPRNKPATYADIKRAEEMGLLFGLRMAKGLVFTALLDKMGWDKEKLHELWEHTSNLSTSVKEGYVKMSDLYQVLREEYEIDI